MESTLHASIKKIEILNKTRKEQWYQSVQIVLSDIELNNDNLITLRRFRPDETVRVSMESLQLDLFAKHMRKRERVEEGITFGEEELGDDETIDREFHF
ncbi:hypothetical protein [Shouchella shacheensis]|uniref:hypothetical protein n=1 Tax=Shouchella shacheensis TaxID=1649580 RepID=UPI00074028A9|nr:hypothetical protein [Shouchella shacheensis]